MTPEALTALKASIRHWKKNIAAKTPDDANIGSKNCALCQAFFRNECFGCPVSASTRRFACRGTPYVNAARAGIDWFYYPDSTKARDAWRKAAQAELDFLRSLLPLEQEEEAAK